LFTLADKQSVTAGVHTLKIDLSNFPGGVYFFEVDFKGKINFHQIKKMIYLK